MIINELLYHNLMNLSNMEERTSRALSFHENFRFWFCNYLRSKINLNEILFVDFVCHFNCRISTNRFQLVSSKILPRFRRYILYDKFSYLSFLIRLSSCKRLIIHIFFFTKNDILLKIKHLELTNKFCYQY